MSKRERVFEFLCGDVCNHVCVSVCVCGLLAPLLCVGFGCWFDYSFLEPRTLSTSVCHNLEPSTTDVYTQI